MEGNSRPPNQNPMLLFYCADEADLSTIHREGVRAPEGAGLSLRTSLETARVACDACLLVVEAAALSDLVFDDDDPASARTSYIPPAAVGNLDPYLSPKTVTAAGGYVARPGADEPEVLLIFRRGAWDLPKGKRDDGETIEACALREVREEIGVDTLHLGPSLGTTMHGYERGGRYHVKTTYWFLMQTPETHFTPEAREGIEAVAWIPWHEALSRLDYASLRDHMRCVEAAVREALRQDGTTS